MPTGVDGETPPSFLFLDKKISGEPEIIKDPMVFMGSFLLFNI